MDANRLAEYANQFQQLCIERWPEVDQISDEMLADMANLMMSVYIARRAQQDESKGFQSLI